MKCDQRRGAPLRQVMVLLDLMPNLPTENPELEAALEAAAAAAVAAAEVPADTHHHSDGTPCDGRHCCDVYRSG